MVCLTPPLLVWLRCANVPCPPSCCLHFLTLLIHHPCKQHKLGWAGPGGQVWQLTLELSRCSISLLEEWCIHSHGPASLRHTSRGTKHLFSSQSLIPNEDFNSMETFIKTGQRDEIIQLQCSRSNKYKEISSLWLPRLSFVSEIGCNISFGS